LQRFPLAVSVETGNLLRNSSSHCPRAGVGNNETQLAQTAYAPSLPHHFHPFGGPRHLGLLRP